MEIDWIKLKYLMDASNITKRELASLIHYSSTTVYRIFSGERHPTMEFIARTINALGITKEEARDIFILKTHDYA